MRYHVMTDIRSRMTTKGPEAPAMLGHPDIMVFVLVVFWCVTLCDFVTCYSGCKNSCKYLMYAAGNNTDLTLHKLFAHCTRTLELTAVNILCLGVDVSYNEFCKRR